MNTIKRLMVAMAAFAAAAPAGTLPPTVIFTLDPADGHLAGAAGTSVGWGYTISSTSNYDASNDIPAFVSIDYFSFGDETPVGLFSEPGVPSAVATDGFPIVVPWSPGVSGLQYDIDAGALVGAATEGAMTLTYDVYSDADPVDAIGSSLTVNAQFSGLDANAEVFVNGPAATVPEPGAATLFVLGAVALLLRKWCGTAPASSWSPPGLFPSGQPTGGTDRRRYAAPVSPSPARPGSTSFPFSTSTPRNGSFDISKFPSRSA
jgi:hypothetical protein